MKTTDDARKREMADAVESMKHKLAEIEKSRPRRRMIGRRQRRVQAVGMTPTRPVRGRERRRERKQERRERRQWARNRRKLSRKQTAENARIAAGDLLYALRPRIPEAMRGTGKNARWHRGGVLTLGFMMVSTFPVALLTAGREDERIWWFSIGWGALGALLLVLWFFARPIAKVTFRAWLAAFVHGFRERQHAVNASGHSSARARRSALNRAAWAAQRTRDGRAAAPEYSRRHNDHADARKAERWRRAVQDGLRPEPTKAERRAREKWMA